MSLHSTYLKIKHFVEIDLWRVKLSTLPKSRRFFHRNLRISIISITEFNRDNITEKASALTYYTLLSIIPVLAMAFGVASGFGLESYLEKELKVFFAGQEQILDVSLEFTARMLQTVNGGVIIGISLIFIMYAILRLLYMIEITFNEIWDTKSRNWQRKVSDYLAIMVLAPMFLIFSGAATVVITTSVKNLAKIEMLDVVRPIMLFGIKFIPYFIMWMLMFVLYIIFPNTKVKIRPAIISAVLAGTMFQLAQLAWINGQVYLSNYGVVYGTLAILPLFMIYVQITWMIVLYGAEHAFAIQNADVWEYSSRRIKMSPKHRRKLTILIMYHLVKNFEMRGNTPLSISQLSSLVYVPYRFVKDICHELVDANLANKVHDEDRERYQPALDISQIDLQMIFRKLDNVGFNDLKFNEDEKFQEIEHRMEEINDSIKDSAGNKLVKDL